MRRLFTPRMLALHALVLTVAAVLVSLGMWQLERLDETRARRDFSVLRASEAVANSDSLVGVSLGDLELVDALVGRGFVGTGTYRPADELLQRGRSYGGRQGFHVLTPLDLDNGPTILVRRGYVPFDNELLPPVPGALPPAGSVTVTGGLEPSIPQPTGGVAQRDPDEGTLDVVFNADLARLGPQIASDGRDVAPVLLRLDSQQPAQPGRLPIPAPPPVEGLGPHLSYAIQWFSFATIALGMYALWLRRRLDGDVRAISHSPD
jgi:surfeit locus 1 family protein